MANVGKRHGFVQDRVVHVDTDRKVVRMANGEQPYDTLVASLGYQTHHEDIPGDRDLAGHTWELDAALDFRERLRDFSGGRLVVGVAGPPYRCPPGPYQATWLFDDYLRSRGLRDGTQIDFFTSEPGPVGGSGKPPGFIRKHLALREIALHSEFALETVDGARKVVRAKDGREPPFDLLMIVPPHRPSQALYDSGMVESAAGIEVDYDYLTTRWDGVHAIGDNVNLRASKAGVVAHLAADTVAHTIAQELTAEGHRERFKLHTI